MTRIRALLIPLLASASLATAAHAQGARPVAAEASGAQNGRVAGLVVRQGSGHPIAGAAIGLRSATDSALVGGGFSAADGAFRRVGVRPGRYVVRVRILGFAPIARGDVVVAPGATADLGRIELAAVVTELSAVAVTAERAEVTVSPDRTSYTVKDMPAASGGNAVDVLRNVPSVDVDGDNKVSLRGNENVVVQINGRLSPMRGEALGNFLAQLPANLVARIEVVPNPSAKSDPEGMAGILNIVLKENTELGTSGGFTVGGGTTGQVSASGNLGYQRGPLTLFGNYGFMRDTREVSGFIDRAGLQSGLLPYLEADIGGENTGLSHSLNASADYRLGERDVLSSSFILSDRSPTRINDNLYRELDAEQDVTARYLRAKHMTGSELSLDYTLGYKHSTAQPGDGVSAELRVNRDQDSDDVLLSDQALSTTTGAAEGLAALEIDLTEERSTEWTAQTDLTRTLASRTKLETGYKGTVRRLDNDFAVSTSADGGATYAADLERSNVFLYQEQVHAVYGVLSQGVGAFDLQAGLRAERVTTDFDLATTAERFANDYASVYPSAIVAYNLSDSRQVKASYSKRVTRPRTRQLNPFGWREDALNRFQGNPGLTPEYTHAFELSFQQLFDHGTLQVTPFARHTIAAIRFLRTIDDAGVSVTTFANLATSDSYGADVNGSVRVGPVSGFGGVSLFQQVTDGSNLSTDASNRAFGWTARGNATVKLSPSLDLQGFVMYRAPMRVELGRMTGHSMMNVALRQKVLGDQGSVALRVMDPFNSMGMGFVTDDGRFYQTSQRRFGARGAFLSFSWNFGQAPKRDRQRGAEQPDSPAGPDGQ
jgi:outer membrane receptor protein involved in Fe transport